MRSNRYSAQFGKHEIVFSLKRSERKTLRLVVTPDLAVTVTAPPHSSLDEIRAAVAKRGAWVLRQQERLAEYHPLPVPHRYESGETFTYLGRQYRLRVNQGAQICAKLIGRFLRVTVPDTPAHEAVRRQVDGWFRTHAEAVFTDCVEKCLEVTRRHGIGEPPPVMVRVMKRRWGSRSAAGRITLNVALVGVPKHCIEYVIMHELCHVKHHNHSCDFYRLLTRCMPDWQVRKTCLDKWGLPLP